MLVLTREDVRGLLRTEDVIDAVAAAHAALATGAATQAIDQATRLPGGDGVLLPMVATIDPGTAGLKLLADVPTNPDRGLRPQHSVITMLDAETGRCDALLDGIEITLHRTAAATAVATRLLAREDSRVLGLIGAGAQARTHLAAIRTVRPIEAVVVWSRTRATAERFAADCAADGLSITVASSPEEVVRAADVVCTLTPSKEPYVQGAWFRPGLHVNAVGAPPRPDHREIDSEGLGRSRVVVDDLASALDRSGEVVQAIADGALRREDVREDLGGLVAGLYPGRTDDEEITLFNSVGLALQDMATAHRVVARAREAGLGTEIDLHGGAW